MFLEVSTLPRFLISLALLVLMLLTLLIGAAIVVGIQQPPSEWVSFLHLNDCELPCWIDIEPGKTTFAEARQRVMNAYQSISLYELLPQGEDHFFITDKSQGYSLGVDLRSTDWGKSPQSIVDNIDLQLEENITQPTIAELYNRLGTAEAVVDLPTDSPTVAFYFRHQRVMAWLVKDFACIKVFPTQKIYQISLADRSLKLDLWLSSPWRGFQRCYN
jgi:hypothetical protein